VNTAENVQNVSATNESGGGVFKFIGIGLAAAASGTLLKWFQEVGGANVFVNIIVHTFIVLLPAAITYYLLSREQEKNLGQVIKILDKAMLGLKDLRRVTEIEKNYYANERLLNLERRVIEETGSSMQEVAELVSAFDDGNTLQVRLKERFRLHAKSILTFHRAFSVEVEQNFKNVSQIENEYTPLPHDQRDELVYSTGKERADRVSQRFNLQRIVTSLEQLTAQSNAMGVLADQKHREIVEKLNVTSDEGGHNGH